MPQRTSSRPIPIPAPVYSFSWFVLPTRYKVKAEVFESHWARTACIQHNQDERKDKGFQTRAKRHTTEKLRLPTKPPSDKQLSNGLPRVEEGLWGQEKMGLGF